MGKKCPSLIIEDRKFSSGFTRKPPHLVVPPKAVPYEIIKRGIYTEGNRYLGYFYGFRKEAKEFCLKKEFPDQLLADTEGDIVRGFGAWGPKKFMGRKYEGFFAPPF